MDTNGDAEKPPYLSYTTLRNFIKGIGETGVPNAINKSVMAGASGSTQSYLLSAMRFFNLMDEAGVPTGNLKSLADAVGSEEDYKQAWSGIFTRAYEPIIEGLDLAGATPDELKQRFQAFKYGGDTLRKCHAFFVAAADAGGIELGPYLKKVGRAPSGTSKRVRRSKDGNGSDSEGNHNPAIAALPNAATLLLDASGSRKVVLSAPATVTPKELERIQQWLSFQLIVQESPEKPNDSQSA